MDRRRALMGAGESYVPNNLVPGSYSGGTSSMSVDNEKCVTVHSWPKGWGNAINVPFYHAIPIKSGDSVRIKVTTVSGTISKPFLGYVGVYSGGSSVLWAISNASIGAAGADRTATATEDFDSLYLRMVNNTDNVTFSNWIIKVEIFVNGIRVIPETTGGNV